jgi:GNAT superfamily N-acetyltransferase
VSTKIRDATAADHPFLKKMWHTAAFWQPDVFVMSEADALAVPEIARYIEGWGRAGDVAVIAEIEGEPAGAAWYRTFTAAEPGYGFVDESVPELAIAVERDARRRGVATLLMAALIDRARDAGVSSLSLSVNAGNPSREIYLRAGFVDIREEDGSYVMALAL